MTDVAEIDPMVEEMIATTEDAEEVTDLSSR
jgi:hypothetical protein